MQTKKLEYKTYKFNELSDDAKQKALENHAQWKVIEDDWWECSVDDAIEHILKPIGVTCEFFYFDTERGTIEMKNQDVVDLKALLKAAGADLRKVAAREILNDGIGIDNHGELRAPQWRYRYTCNSDKPLAALIDDMTDLVQGKLEDVLSQLRKEYEYLTSEESILETIECNDIEFLENGESFLGHGISHEEVAA